MWLIFAMSCALADCLATICSKQLMKRKQNPLSVSLFVHGAGTLALLGIIMASNKTIIITQTSLALVALTALIATIAGLAILFSLKKGDLSLISPIQTTTPLIILMLAIFFLSETPSPVGLVGIILVVLGGILLDKNPRESFASLARRIVSYKPALLALFGASMYAVVAVLDEVGLKSVNPLLWMFYVYFFIFVFLLPVAWYRGSIEIKKLSRSKSTLGLTVLFALGAIYFQMQALAIGNVTYVMSIKRLSTVFTVLIAIFIIKEKRAMSRLRGTIIMVIGAILIGLS